MQRWQQTQLPDIHSCGPVENVSSVGGGTATTNVNLRGKLDEVNICEEALGILTQEEAAWPACCCQCGVIMCYQQLFTDSSMDTQ